MNNFFIPFYKRKFYLFVKMSIGYNLGLGIPEIGSNYDLNAKTLNVGEDAIIQEDVETRSINLQSLTTDPEPTKNTIWLDTSDKLYLNSTEITNQETPPAGNDREIQINDSGNFGSESNLTYSSAGQLNCGSIQTSTDIDAIGKIISESTVDSSGSTSLSSLNSKGGLSIAKRGYFGGRVYCEDTSTCSSLGIGSLVISGGISVAQNMIAGTSIKSNSYIEAAGHIKTSSYIEMPENVYNPSETDDLIRLIAYQGWNGGSKYQQLITPQTLSSSTSSANFRFSTENSGEVFSPTSSIRYKQDIEPVDFGDNILNLQPVRYRYKTDVAKNANAYPGFSFIAEDAYQVNPYFAYCKLYQTENIPEDGLVSAWKSDNSAAWVVEGINEDSIRVGIVSAIQNLDKDYRTLQANFETLQQDYTNLLTRVEALENN